MKNLVNQKPLLIWLSYRVFSLTLKLIVCSSFFFFFGSSLSFCCVIFFGKFCYFYHIFAHYFCFRTLVLNAKVHIPFQYAIGISTAYVLIILQIVSLESLCECKQIWYYLLVRDISWFQYWRWKLRNLSILFDTLWLPFHQKAWGYLHLLWKIPSPKSDWCLFLEECITCDLIISNKLRSLDYIR